MSKRRFKKKYLPYKRGKLRIPANLVVILAAAVILFIIAVIIGAVFRHRLESEDIPEDPFTFITTEEDKEEETPSLHDESLAFSKFSAPAVTNKTTAEEMGTALYALKEKGDTGISFTAINKNGKITYASAAVSEASGLAPSEALIPMTTLTTLFSTARSYSLRISVVVYYNGSDSEALVIGELLALGADEIIISCPAVEDFGESTCKALLSLISDCRGDTGADFGLAFLPEVYRNERNLPFVEEAYKGTELVLLDLCDLSAEDAAGVITELSAPLTDYEARALLGAVDAVGSAKIDSALSGIGLRARQFRDPLIVEEKADDTEGTEGDSDE